MKLDRMWTRQVAAQGPILQPDLYTYTDVDNSDAMH